MPNDSHHVYSAKDLCRIIEYCGKNGVRELKLSDISLTFGNFREIEERSSEPAHRILTVVPSQPEISEKDEVEAKEERLAQMLIEDPVGYERLLQEEALS